MMSLAFRKRVKTIIGSAAGASGILGRRFGSAMTIVAFHRITDHLPEDGMTCTPGKFEQFCLYFSNHFRVVPLTEQVAASQLGRDMSGTLSITFDDGYLDNYEVAAPILRKLRLPATFFVTTGFVGTSIVAPWDDVLVTPQHWMTWDDIRSLAAQGFDVGSHSHMHLDLGTESAENIRRDLQASQSKIQQELGTSPKLFAYPFGGREHISESSRTLVKQLGFDCCASCHGGVNPAVPDPYRLNRIGIAEWFATPQQFGLELALGLA